MRGTLNYKNVKESKPGDFEILPEGVYTGKVKAVNETNRSGEPLETQSGYPFVNVIFEVTDGEYEGRSAFHNVVFFPPDSKGSGITYHFLKVLGESLNPKTGQFDYDTSQWPELNQFRFKIKHEEYNGKIQAKVEWIDYLSPEEHQRADEIENLKI